MSACVFDRALEEHAGLIERVVAAYERNPAGREDVKQDIALALWRAAPAWRGDCTLRTFVARIAHNVCVSHIRRSLREPRGAEVDPGLACDAERPDDVVARSDLSRRLISAVAALPHGLREVATLVLEDFSTQEIAQALGLSEAAVFTRVNRAKAALRAIMVKP
jgi:RNA polymerase sigma factor (sigma-70 family)